MWTQTLAVVVVWIAAFGPTVGQEKPTAPTPAQNRLGELVAQGEGPYTKVGVGAWSTPYRGKNLPIITIRIAAADGGIFFFVDLFERKSITLSRNLLLKIAELNSHFDYGKVVLSEDYLQLRLDVRSKLIDLEEFKAMEQQTASLADEAYGVIKDFVQ
jgi:hypothetical protein